MKFYGQFDLPVDRFIFERYFPDPGHRGVFVECGAFDGETECSCRLFEESMGWTGYNLEPVPHIFERLEVNRPDSRNLKHGLSDRNGTVTFDCVIHPQYGRYTTIGSIDHGTEERDALAAAGCEFEEIEIEVVTWKELIAREGIEVVDLMVLDVEGHELSVLGGMADSEVLPHVMCVEFGHVGFGELRSAMRGLGYEYDITSYANAYFVRKDVLPLFAMRRAAAQSPALRPSKRGTPPGPPGRERVAAPERDRAGEPRGLDHGLEELARRSGAERHPEPAPSELQAAVNQAAPVAGSRA